MIYMRKYAFYSLAFSSEFPHYLLCFSSLNFYFILFIFFTEQIFFFFYSFMHTMFGSFLPPSPHHLIFKNCIIVSHLEEIFTEVMSCSLDLVSSACCPGDVTHLSERSQIELHHSLKTM
jgi:hypothetical protein